MNLSTTLNLKRDMSKRYPSLVQVLDFWGVRSLEKRVYNREGHRKINNATALELWNFFDAARSEHRRLILKEHPDRGGSWRRAAHLNSIWDRTVILFARKGIRPEGTKT